MKILVASSFLPFERTRYGGARRLYNIARELSREHEVTVVSFDGCGEMAEWDGSPPFEHFLALPAPKRGRVPSLRYASAAPLPAAQRAALRAFFSGRSYDLVVFGYALAPNLLRVPEVAASGRKVYIEGDLVIWQADVRRRAARGVMKLLFALRYVQIRAYYRSFLRHIDTFFLSTETEIAEVRARFPATPARQLPHGVEAGAAEFLRTPGPAGRVGFFGNFGHRPNLDAAEWFLEHVHPRLGAAREDYRLVLAGMNLPEGLRARVAGDPRVIACGAVDRAEDFYREVSFVVNPIVSGRGVRTKLMEAATYGRAVVSTSLGAEGARPLELVIGDSPQAFAAGCLRLLDGSADLEALAARNRKVVENSFSAEGVCRTLLSPPGFV